MENRNILYINIHVKIYQKILFSLYQKYFIKII